MDDKSFSSLQQALLNGSIHDILPYLIEISIEYGKDIPADMANHMDETGFDWRYYQTMVYYAIEWHRHGFSPGKLKKLMNEAISDLKGQDIDSGKRSAMNMFKEYLRYKKEIDERLSGLL